MRTKKYSDEFKSTAFLLSYLDGFSIKSVAESLDIHPVMFSIWRQMVDEGKTVLDKRKKTGYFHPLLVDDIIHIIEMKKTERTTLMDLLNYTQLN